MEFEFYTRFVEIWGIQFEADKHEDRSLHAVNEDRSAQDNKEMDLQIFKQDGHRTAAVATPQRRR